MSRGYGAMLFKQSPRVQKTIRLMVTPVPTEMNVTFITYPVLQALQYDYYLYQLYQMMIILLLFLQKQNLALAVYLFGSVLSLPD
jgi:hypothetical protein